jgi:protein TonB
MQEEKREYETNSRKGDAPMFEQVLLEGVRPGNKGWTLLVSSGMQVGLVATFSLIPLLNTELLPRITLQMMMVAPSPPPPPPAPAAARIQQARPVARRQFDGLHLATPTRIPERIAVLVNDELPPAAGSGPGVPGGLETGIPGGVNTMSPRLLETTPPAPQVAATPAEAPAPITRLTVGGRVQEALILHKVIPVYPPLARQTRISGIVRFTAIIAKDGTIQNLTVISGHPMLMQAAAQAVRQWRYRPTLLNGDPVEVVAPIEVIFTLNQ